MNQNTISIIIPAYNIAPYLERCVNSILAQTHRELEIIVVNDGSTDDTGAVVDRLAASDSRIKAIHKENGGVSSARIRGVRESTGAFIGFVDGDDYVEPEMFAHLLKNALEHGADISHCGYQMVFPDGHVDLYYGTGNKRLQDQMTGLRDLLQGRFVEPSPCNKLFSRQTLLGFEYSPLWDNSLKYNEDVLMNYILFSRAQKSIYEDIPFYHYILRAGSAATSKKKHYQVRDPRIVMERILGDVSSDSPLYPIAYERYLRTLMGIAGQCDWPEEQAQAKQLLRRHALRAQRTPGISGKFRLMVFVSTYLEPAYKLIRRVYEKRTGIGKKYDLE